MSKRPRRDQLTGGSGDVSPQWLSCPTATQSAADTTTTQEVVLPVTRMPGTAKVTVLEFLKFAVYHTGLPVLASATETLDTLTVVLSTSTGGTTNLAFNDSRVIGYMEKLVRGAFTATGTYYSHAPPNPYIMDLTDGAGHGILVATDSVFLQVQSIATGNSNTANCKILYRFKEVALMEYLGIVQSQQ